MNKEIKIYFILKKKKRNSMLFQRNNKLYSHAKIMLAYKILEILAI